MNLLPISAMLMAVVVLAVVFQVGYLVRVGLAAGVIRMPFGGNS